MYKGTLATVVNSDSRGVRVMLDSSFQNVFLKNPFTPQYRQGDRVAVFDYFVVKGRKFGTATDYKRFENANTEVDMDIEVNIEANLLRALESPISRIELESKSTVIIYDPMTNIYLSGGTLPILAISTKQGEALDKVVEDGLRRYQVVPTEIMEKSSEDIMPRKVSPNFQTEYKGLHAQLYDVLSESGNDFRLEKFKNPKTDRGLFLPVAGCSYDDWIPADKMQKLLFTFGDNATLHKDMATLSESLTKYLRNNDISGRNAVIIYTEKNPTAIIAIRRGPDSVEKLHNIIYDIPKINANLNTETKKPFSATGYTTPLPCAEYFDVFSNDVVVIPVEHINTKINFWQDKIIPESELKTALNTLNSSLLSEEDKKLAYLDEIAAKASKNLDKNALLAIEGITEASTIIYHSPDDNFRDKKLVVVVGYHPNTIEADIQKIQGNLDGLIERVNSGIFPGFEKRYYGWDSPIYADIREVPSESLTGNLPENVKLVELEGLVRSNGVGRPALLAALKALKDNDDITFLDSKYEKPEPTAEIPADLEGAILAGLADYSPRKFESITLLDEREKGFSHAITIVKETKVDLGLLLYELTGLSYTQTDERKKEEVTGVTWMTPAAIDSDSSPTIKYKFDLEEVDFKLSKHDRIPIADLETAVNTVSKWMNPPPPPAEPKWFKEKTTNAHVFYNQKDSQYIEMLILAKSPDYLRGAENKLNKSGLRVIPPSRKPIKYKNGIGRAYLVEIINRGNRIEEISDRGITIQQKSDAFDPLMGVEDRTIREMLSEIKFPENHSRRNRN